MQKQCYHLVVISAFYLRDLYPKGGFLAVQHTNENCHYLTHVIIMHLWNSSIFSDEFSRV